MTRIHIANMTCGGCARAVTATLGAAAPGAVPSFDLERREVALEGEFGAPLIAALVAAGWQAELLPH